MNDRIRDVRKLARGLGCKLCKVPARERPARVGDYRLTDSAGATTEASLAEIELVLLDERQIETTDGPLTPRDGWRRLDDWD